LDGGFFCVATPRGERPPREPQGETNFPESHSTR
jgi:hypothetical protein